MRGMCRKCESWDFMDETNAVYGRDEIERLLFQMDNILHARVNYLLVAQSIFFLAGAAAWAEFLLVMVLFVLGTTTAVLFTFTNLKLYWRVTWLISKLMSHCQLYRHYIEMKDIEANPGNWGPITRHLMRRSILDGPPPRYLDTGFLYTWGLLWIMLVGWVLLVVISIVSLELATPVIER